MGTVYLHTPVLQSGCLGLQSINDNLLELEVLIWADLYYTYPIVSTYYSYVTFVRPSIIPIRYYFNTTYSLKAKELFFFIIPTNIREACGILISDFNGCRIVSSFNNPTHKEFYRILIWIPKTFELTTNMICIFFLIKVKYTLLVIINTV